MKISKVEIPWTLLCLEHEIRRAQMNRESVVAIFLDIDIDKAYDFMWKEGFFN